MNFILRYILKLFAKAVIWKYQPTVVGITGNVGKSSSKEAIFAVVNSRFSAGGGSAVGGKARRNLKNYNNEIGLPLAILGEESAGKNIFKWLAIFLRASRLLAFRLSYPEILILEMGADKPGDIGYLLSIVRPKIGVVTAIGEIPAHVEFFAGPEELALEKSKLAAALPADGFAILNFDDDTVLAMKNKTKAHPLTFGLGEGASVRATDIHLSFRREDGEPSGGLSFKVSHKGSIVPVRLANVFGKHQIYAALAALAVGSALNMNLVEISQALAGYKSPPGRLNLLKGIKNTVILDDTYNASPMAARAALETLGEISLESQARKIAVLGDMLEIGKYTIGAHQEIGRIARKIADVIFTVGPRAKFIAEEAEELGFPKDKIFRFDDSAAAGKELQKILQEGDLILVKGSQSMRMEKIVEEIMAEPLRAKELLARQGEEWKN
ncbi:MAG: Mur ligase family protein [Patescibacteria group bacterium]